MVDASDARGPAVVELPRSAPDLTGAAIARGRPTAASGKPLPLGVHDCFDGFNFALFSRHAVGVTLLLFDDAQSAQPCATFELDQARHRTGDIWHIVIEGVRFGQAYAFRVDGRFAPEEGLRFDADRVLLDPYALAVSGMHRGGGARISKIVDSPSPVSADNASVPKCILVPNRFDWQGTRKPMTPWSETIIYEMHVRGFTAHASANAAAPGTFLGVIERIPYLRELGITAVELMPVHEFNGNDIDRTDPSTGAPLTNYWGYSSVAFFAPNEGYATRPGAQVDEFKTMVRELHRVGIEVILDVVFNHTAEGDEHGPTLSFRGIDNPIYYMLAPDARYYQNFSGCGNTLNCNHPVVRDFVIDCLRYWAAEMQVDGFRFDLASILGRDSDGTLLASPPLLERIAEDPVLRDVKLIAEAWDAAGAYQVGSFSGRRWSEWNGQFRDDVRRFWRGDSGMTGALASRLCGSADLYQRAGRAPINSINFITSHDGFTLADLVSYQHKHNEGNGEGNRDGGNQHYSANHGVEGPSDDPAILALRVRQSKNLLATLLLARGVPMILGGDEFARSQNGNNNAYCQDNATSWFDWVLVRREAKMLRFVRGVIALRRRQPALREDRFYNPDEIAWFGAGDLAPDWHGPSSALGCVIRGPHGDAALCLLFNAGTEDAAFTLPPAPPDTEWRVAIDTSAESPDDFAEPGRDRPLSAAPVYRQPAHCLVLLLAEQSPKSLKD